MMSHETAFCLCTLLISVANSQTIYTNHTIEWALLNWETTTPLGDQFPTDPSYDVNFAIKAYDHDTDTIWSLGGATFEDELYAYHVPTNTLTFHDLSATHTHAAAQSWCTTNAVIVNSTMYFGTAYSFFAMELKPPFTWVTLLDSNLYHYYGCVVTNNERTKLYITSTFYNRRTVTIWNLAFGIWTTFQSQLQYDHINGVSVMTSNNVLYLIKGDSNDAANYTEYVNVDDLERDPTLSWNVIHTPSALAQHSSVILDNKEESIYYIGGAGTPNSVWKLNIANDSWQELDFQLPFEIAYTPIMYPVDNKIYSVRSLSDEILHTKMDIYDPVITEEPSTAPTEFFSEDPTNDPTTEPTVEPTTDPTTDPTNNPTYSAMPTFIPESTSMASSESDNPSGLGKSENNADLTAVIVVLAVLLCLSWVVCGYYMYQNNKQSDQETAMAKMTSTSIEMKTRETNSNDLDHL